MRPSHSLRVHRLAAHLLIILCLAMIATPLAADSKDPVLRITGALTPEAVTLALSDMRALPVTTIDTQTVVTDGVHRFTGVLMRDLLAHVGVVGDTVTATALNDYVVDIPMRDFEAFDVIVAYAMDSAALDRADKGPLWIVYPRDSHPELQDIRFDYRWVWQLSGLHVQ